METLYSIPFFSFRWSSKSVSHFNSACKKWLCKVHWKPNRWSPWMRWCWSQDKDQRGRLGRQWNPQDPSWCSSPFLEHFHMIVSDTYFLTHHSVLAKEDVDNSNVLMPGVVVLTFLRVRMKSNLCKVQSNWWQYVTPLIQRQEGRPCVFSSRSSARLRCRRGLRQLPAYKFDWPVLPW